MWHIHDELTYLKKYEIIALNDKYLSQFSNLSPDDIILMCDQYKQLIRLARRDEDKFVEDQILDEENCYVTVKIKELHLYILVLECLDELYDRYVRSL